MLDGGGTGPSSGIAYGEGGAAGDSAADRLDHGLKGRVSVFPLLDNEALELGQVHETPRLSASLNLGALDLFRILATALGIDLAGDLADGGSLLAGEAGEVGVELALVGDADEVEHVGETDEGEFLGNALLGDGIAISDALDSSDGFDVCRRLRWAMLGRFSISLAWKRALLGVASGDGRLCGVTLRVREVVLEKRASCSDMARSVPLALRGITVRLHGDVGGLALQPRPSSAASASASRPPRDRCGGGRRSAVPES